MSIQCQVCGKKPSPGNQYVRSGKPKYLGGNGVKVRGISRRFFLPNLQTLQCESNGTVRKMRVCVACIRSGRIQRPTKRKPFDVSPTG